jgi:hypothetical protein
MRHLRSSGSVGELPGNGQLYPEADPIGLWTGFFAKYI